MRVTPSEMVTEVMLSMYSGHTSKAVLFTIDSATGKCTDARRVDLYE